MAGSKFSWRIQFSLGASFGNFGKSELVFAQLFQIFHKLLSALLSDFVQILCAYLSSRIIYVLLLFRYRTVSGDTTLFKLLTIILLRKTEFATVLLDQTTTAVFKVFQISASKMSDAEDFLVRMLDTLDKH